MEGDRRWIDVGPLLEAARTGLPVGQMVQAESFSLFEAMSAVEVGNPKMDAAAHKKLSVQELLAEGKAPVSLTPKQLCAVMHQLMLQESSHYHGGNAAASTVYTSLYMMDIARLEQGSPLLAAFCRGVETTALAVRWLIMYGAVSEEEDFNVLVTGLPLEQGSTGNGKDPTPAVLPQLSQAQATAERLAKEAGGKGEVEAQAAYTTVAKHLEFRHHLVQALLDIKDKTPKSVVSASMHLQQAAALLSSVLPSSGEGQEAPGEGAAAADSGHLQAGPEADDAPGFVPGLNHHLLAPAPPRVVKAPTQQTAHAAWAAMLQQLVAAVSVSPITGLRALQQHVNSLAALRAGVVARSAAHWLLAGKTWATTQPTPTSQPEGAAAAPTYPPWVLDQPMLCAALALPQGVGAISEDVDVFVEQAVIAVSNWIQAMLLNPCRVRRRLRRSMEDWGNLYQHALNADISPKFKLWMKSRGWQWQEGKAGPPSPVTGQLDPQGPLATWVEAETCASQLGHILTGFQLELYSPQEFCMLYWYCSALFTGRRSALQLLHLVQAPVGSKPKLPPPPGKGKKGAPPPPAQPLQDPATVRRQSGLIADALIAELGGHMAGGMVRLLVGLNMAGIMTDPKLDFKSIKERFDQRFASFHSPSLVKPEPLSYAHFVAAMDVSGASAQDMLRLAADTFTHLRNTYKLSRSPQSMAMLADVMSPEQQSELAAMDKVAATNGLAATLLLRALGTMPIYQQAPVAPSAAENSKESAAGKTASGDSSSSLPPKESLPSVSYEFNVLPQFPTIAIKSAATKKG